jgi:hypothetical protein
VVVYPLIFLVVKDGDILRNCFTLWPWICLVANMKTIMKKSKLVLTLTTSWPQCTKTKFLKGIDLKTAEQTYQSGNHVCDEWNGKERAHWDNVWSQNSKEEIKKGWSATIATSICQLWDYKRITSSFLQCIDSILTIKIFLSKSFW